MPHNKIKLCLFICREFRLSQSGAVLLSIPEKDSPTAENHTGPPLFPFLSLGSSSARVEIAGLLG